MPQSLNERACIGWWWPKDRPPLFGDAEVYRSLQRVSEPILLLNVDGKVAIGEGGHTVLGRDSRIESSQNPHERTKDESLDAAAASRSRSDGYPILAYVAPCRPENLGDPGFREDYRLRYAYVAGSMANGITSAEMVEAMGRAGMLGSFGAAGLSPQDVEAALDRIQARLGNLPYASNLIHSPNEPDLENALADLYIRRKVRVVEASAYINLTLPLIRYRIHGIHRPPAGEIVTPNRVIAKVSRIEVATRFFSPPPEKMVSQLVEQGHITRDQAVLAARIPVAQDLTAEADSGGHTDNRPLVTVLPTMIALKDALQSKHGFTMPMRVGAGGGIGTPAAAAAAFSMGAAYVMVGSVHQACVESGTSDAVRDLLAKTEQADLAMAPAADMFEMGVKVQVIKRGTMFAMRAGKLYDHYRLADSIDAISKDQRAALEREIFQKPLNQVWEETIAYFRKRDPAQIDRARTSPKHQMALVFRWYLGQASRWANRGETTRRLDYQVWCGPSMGAFNEWVRGSFLEARQERKVVTVAMNLLVGAAILTRVQGIKTQGIPLSPTASRVTPLGVEEIQQCLA